MPEADEPDLLPNLLFVYGLLQPGLTGFRALQLGQHVRVIGPDRIRGRLYDLGRYPGVRLDQPGIVRGAVLQICSGAARQNAICQNVIWKRLDAYEQYDPRRPARSEYQRRTVTLLESGQSAWIYECCRTAVSHRVISSGIWRRAATIYCSADSKIGGQRVSFL